MRSEKAIRKKIKDSYFGYPETFAINFEEYKKGTEAYDKIINLCNGIALAVLLWMVEDKKINAEMNKHYLKAKKNYEKENKQ